MLLILFAISVSSMVLQDSLFNSVSKKYLRTMTDNLFYNCLLYFVAFIAFLCAAIGSKVSAYSILLGALFGAVTLLMNSCKIKAMATGPLHLTVMIVTSSMIIPALSGVVLWNEKFSAAKAVAVVLLLLCIRVSLGKGGGGVYKKGWLLFCICAFLADGGIGILQKFHQSSIHRDELLWFLTTAFFVASLFSGAASVTKKKTFDFSAKDYILVIVSGLCTFSINYFNLLLAGKLPSQLFFPLVNGSSVILTGIVSTCVFKEKITVAQFLGMAGGLLSLILICIL